jgi:hypothetical protein
MNRTLQPARALFAIGLLGLGVLALVYHVWLVKTSRPAFPSRRRGVHASSALRVGWIHGFTWVERSSIVASELDRGHTSATTEPGIQSFPR